MTDIDDEVPRSPERESAGSASTPQHSPTVAMMDSVIALGAEKLIGIGAAALIAIGYFAPLVTAQTGGFFSSSTTVSYALSQAGFPGLLALALGLALALLPFNAARFTFANRDLITYGVSCALFGTLALLWLGSLSLPMIISSVGSLSIGFYALIAGFALNVFATAKRLKESMQKKIP